jgi:hypothetical protein
VIEEDWKLYEGWGQLAKQPSYQLSFFIKNLDIPYIEGQQVYLTNYSLKGSNRSLILSLLQDTLWINYFNNNAD